MVQEKVPGEAYCPDCTIAILVRLNTMIQTSGILILKRVQKHFSVCFSGLYAIIILQQGKYPDGKP